MVEERRSGAVMRVRVEMVRAVEVLEDAHREQTVLRRAPIRVIEEVEHMRLCREKLTHEAEECTRSAFSICDGEIDAK